MDQLRDRAQSEPNRRRRVRRGTARTDLPGRVRGRRGADDLHGTSAAPLGEGAGGSHRARGTTSEVDVKFVAGRRIELRPIYVRRSRLLKSDGRIVARLGERVGPDRV